MRRSHVCKRGKNSASVFQRVSSLQEPPKKTRMTPKDRVRKHKKLTAQITKLTQQQSVVVRKAGNTVGGHTQCRPRRKEGNNIDRIDRIDSNKNTPDLRTLVTTHQSWAKNNLPERKNLAHNSDRRGLPTVKENELLCSLIRTAHEIHYR